MSSTPKKSSASKKPAAERAKRGNGAGKEESETGRLVEKANDHMERAWEKIYERSHKAGASKK